MHVTMERTGLPSGAPAVPGVELLELIGRGGSGAVYRGRQAQLGRDVAVKVVSARGTPEASQARWRREVSALSRLSNHPNIVSVYDGGTTADGSPYLVMPYVPGGTLKDRLRSGPLPPAEAARVGAKLAGALASSHAAGVLHRDVKPENVLLSPYGEPQLADFGIARMADGTTTTGADLQATIPYAAPEILDGRTATEAADVYGLGATLHACLTGSPPYVAGPDEHMVALVGRVLTQPPPSLVEHGVPVPLAEVVGRAMARDPERRQGSAAELRRELDAVADRLSASPTASHEQPTVNTPLLDAGAATAVAAAAAPQVHSPPPERGPSRQHAVVKPARAVGPPPPVAPTPATPTASRQSRRALLPIALVAALALLAVAAWAVLRDGSGADDTETAAPTTSAPATTPAPATPAPTTAVPTTAAPTTAAPPSTSSPTTAASSNPPPADIASAASTYFATLDAGDLDRAWQLTSPRFQNAQDRSSWQRFWSSVGAITIVGPLGVDRARGVVVVPLTLDGQREDYTLELVEQGGAWLVNGPVGNS
jgi:serine/threonine-protein kinase PknK